MPSPSPSPSSSRTCVRSVVTGPGAVPASGNSCGGRLVLAFLALEQRVLLEHAVDLGVELERRQLQQPDRLLQLRRQGEVLGELELERLFHQLHR